MCDHKRAGDLDVRARGVGDDDERGLIGASRATGAGSEAEEPKEQAPNRAIKGYISLGRRR